MASLKEIKTRIASIQSTQKITSAMRMVASAKLHKAQALVEGMYPYQRQLDRIAGRLLTGEGAAVSPYMEQRPVERVAIVAFSSNTALCGAFNANVIRKLTQVVEEHRAAGRQLVRIYTVGKKVEDAVRKMGYEVDDRYRRLSEKPGWEDACRLAAELKQLFLNGEADRVELLYYHFKSSGTQILQCETYLPLTFETGPEDGTAGADCYLVEPSVEELVERLVPALLDQKMLTVAVDSNASEHAIRMMAMQAATDNANQLIQELKLQYNKVRQQAITSELLDIVGGSMR